MQYAHATWQRLLPFFRLPGRVLPGWEVVEAEVRSFNNRQLTRDLLAVCQRVNEVGNMQSSGSIVYHTSSLSYQCGI